MPILVVAALSARMLAEAARRDGFDVIALDLFGDTDTRTAAASHSNIGEPATLQIDASRLHAALGDAARQAGVLGWVAGSGFDGRPELLGAGAAVLPLIGTAAEAVARVRDPAQFFAVLTTQGIAYPAVQTAPPTDGAGWLAKDASGCGGWHIRRVAAGAGAVADAPTGAVTAAVATSASHPNAQTPTHFPPGAGRYFQREVAGVPMSATFIADGRDAVLLGCNELMIRPVAGRPFVFCGAVGPVPLPSEVAAQVRQAVRAVSAEFKLRGLCSLDFICAAGQIKVLEVNPRPSASMALYAAQPFLQMHVRACLHGELPPELATPSPVQGYRIVFARRAVHVDVHAAQHLADTPGVHDRPEVGSHIGPDEPLCSVSTEAADADQAKAGLDARAEQMLRTLEAMS